MSRREILLPWVSQPQEAAGIDWSNPLAASLRILFTGSQAPEARDLVTGRVWTPRGHAGQVVGTDGKALSFDGTDDSFDITSYPELSGSVGTFFAWLPVVRSADVGSPNSGSIFLSGASVYFQIGGGANSGKTAVHGSLFNSSGAALTWYNTTKRSIVLSSGGSAATLKTFVDGRDSGHTYSGAPSAWAAGAKPLRLGGFTENNAYDLNADILVAGYSSIPWSEGMARRFHANPFEIFAPRRIWVPVSAAGGPPTLAAIAAGNLTASGARLTVT